MAYDGPLAKVLFDQVAGFLFGILPTDAVMELVQDFNVSPGAQPTLADFVLANFNGGRQPLLIPLPWHQVGVPPPPDSTEYFFNADAQLTWAVADTPAVNPQDIVGFVIYRLGSNEVQAWGALFSFPGGAPMRTLGDEVKLTPTILLASILAIVP